LRPNGFEDARAAACSNVSLAGFSSSMGSGTTAYSARAPPFRHKVGAEALAEALVTRCETRDPCSDRLDVAGKIRSRDAVLRSANPRAHDPEHIRDASHRVPDIGVDRRRSKVVSGLISEYQGAAA
jgi:hypothetical protein